jgi:hypothetical protein
VVLEILEMTLGKILEIVEDGFSSTAGTSAGLDDPDCALSWVFF